MLSHPTMDAPPHCRGAGLAAGVAIERCCMFHKMGRVLTRPRLRTSRRDKGEHGSGRRPPSRPPARERGPILRFLAWLGFGPEAELSEREDAEARRRRRAEKAERRARRTAERRRRREVGRRGEDAERLGPMPRPAPDGGWHQGVGADATAHADIEERIRVAQANAATAAARVGEDEIVTLKEDLDRATRDASARLEELESCLTELETTANAETRAPADARTQLTQVEERAARARREAREAWRSVGAISSCQAQVRAERRRHEEAERRSEAQCVELRLEIDALHDRAAEQGGAVDERFVAELRRGAEELEHQRQEMKRVTERSDRLLQEIEERAITAAQRVAAAELELVRRAERLRQGNEEEEDGERRSSWPRCDHCRATRVDGGIRGAARPGAVGDPGQARARRAPPSRGPPITPGARESAEDSELRSQRDQDRLTL